MGVWVCGGSDGLGNSLGGSASTRLARLVFSYAYSAVGGCHLRWDSASYYDPELGRFLTRDPIGYPDGWNNYHSLPTIDWNRLA